MKVCRKTEREEDRQDSWTEFRELRDYDRKGWT